MAAHIEMPDFVPDVDRPHVQKIMKRTTFIDIETSMMKAYVFRTGRQVLGVDDLVPGEQTRLLTAAWGSWYDMHNDGIDGVVSVSNHHRKAAFKRDPLDDTYVLRQIWKVLDESDIIVAHNAAFDNGWIQGRFLDLGWKLPSKYYVYCTYRNLHGFSSVSKKLDYLSQKWIGTQKVDTGGKKLWQSCHEGDVEAFEKMEEYNIGDIYDTLYQVFLKGALYAPEKSVDLSGEGLYCRVTGHALTKQPEPYVNRNTGLHYHVWKNDEFGFTYRDRYNIRSKKADQGYIRPLVSNGLL